MLVSFRARLARLERILIPFRPPRVRIKNMPEVPAFSPGACVGDYRIVHTLGVGGMGVVYRVEHVETGGAYRLSRPCCLGLTWS